MTEGEGMRAEVLLDPQVTPEHECLLVDTLAELGVTASCEVLPPRRAVEPLTWLILVAVPLQAFLGGIGGKAAEDSYSRLQNVVRALLNRSTPAAPRPLVLQDPATGLQVVLDADLSNEGYQQLIELDLTRFRVGPVRYDQTQRRWRSDLDEAQPH